MMPTYRPTLTKILPLLALMALGAFLRLFDLTDQPIDFHPTRQLRGAIVARGIYYQIAPAADETTRRQAAAFQASTGQYEPPILEGLTALTYLAIGSEAFWIARIYTTLFWLIGGLAVLGLGRGIAASYRKVPTPPPNPTAVWISAMIGLAFYLVLPFSVQASRSIQPDPGMVMWLALAAAALWWWSEKTTCWWRTLALGAACGMAILTKAVIVFPIAGALVGVILYTYLDQTPLQGKTRLPLGRALLNMALAPQIWLVAVLAVLPTAVYYLSRQGRAAEYFSSWTLALSHLLLQPRFYLGWLNLVQELVTPAALLLALAGLILAHGRARGLLLGLWIGYLVYGLFLPYQMDTHSYYHLQLVFLVAISMLPIIYTGIEALLRRSQIWRMAAAAAMLALLAISCWQALIPLYSQDYRNEPAYWQTIASYLPSDGKIVALTQDYGYRLMYYGWRKVTLWPNRGEIKLGNLRGSSKEFEQFFKKRTQDKSYFLITAFRQYEDQPALQQTLAQGYPLLAEGPGYLIFDLTHSLSAVP